MFLETSAEILTGLREGLQNWLNPCHPSLVESIPIDYNISYKLCVSFAVYTYTVETLCYAFYKAMVGIH